MDYLVVKLPLPSKRVLNAVADWFFPLLFSAFLVARCIVFDANSQLSVDEILSWYPANASFGRMLSSTTDTINGAPPLYFILAWFWTAACGKSALALRLFSTFGSAAAICLMSIVLRRAYGRLAAAVAWLVATTDGAFLGNSSYARFHTLIAAEVALAILLYQRIVAQPRPSKRLLVCNACVHGAIVLTYYLGPLYSGTILAGFVLSGLAFRRNPLPGSLSVMAGWLAFVPWIPAFIRHQSLAKPVIWIPVPTFKELKVFYDNVGTQLSGLVTPVVAFALAAFLIITLLAVFTEKKPGIATRRYTVRPRELPLLVLAPCLLLVPVAVYWISVRPGGTSVFLYRYFVPCVLGSTILFAHTASRAIELCFLIPKSFYRHAVVTSLIVLLGVETLRKGIDGVKAVSQQAIGTQPRPADFPAVHTPGEPVVVEHIHQFLTILYFSQDPHRYVFPVDPEVGLADGAGSANHKIMAGLGRHFPEFAGVKSTEDFFASAHSFWFQPGDTKWYPMRLEHNPLFVADSRQGGLLHFHRVELHADP